LRYFLLTWVQNGLVGCEKTIYSMNNDYFVSVGLKRTNKKICNIVSPYQQELFKERPCLATFCTQPVNY